MFTPLHTSDAKSSAHPVPAQGNRMPFFQPKLTVNTPGDAHEQEADRVADQVMRMKEGDAPIVQRMPLTPVTGLQRKCTECEKEEKEQVQRKETGSQAGGHTAPSIVSNVLASGGGQPMDGGTRQFMESRFGQDFGQVRIHTGTQAAESAAAIQARAYTSGRDVVFGQGEYRPGSEAGRRLLAHELAHVGQQGNKTVSHQVSRKLKVESPGGSLPGTPPRQNWEDVKSYMQVLSPNFNVVASGDVTPNSTAFCNTTPSRTVDQCLCDLHKSSNNWKIKIDDTAWPHTEPANHRVTVHSSRSFVQFGAWGGGAQSGQRISQDNPRVLGHELCGHAWLFEKGTHPTGPAMVRIGGRLMGRPSHDPTVVIENQVAKEIHGANAPERGLFADPHHGESFAQITVSGFPLNSKSVADLSGDMQARLTYVKNEMVKEATLRADIIGHADTTGSASANAKVSLNRAKKVRDHLISLGIASSRFIVVRGNGSADCPAVPANNPDCRKVDLFLFNFEGASERFP